MKHAMLYRKWRPRRMGEIVGQEPVVRTLSRAIETGRVAHAYLFSGPRGTGKTSTAKVLAMGLNCERGPTPEPDGTCESCRAIVNNSSLDVVEMDAASNRGIDEIRDLRDRVNLAPVAGRMKVYIIDEVHMLTAEAFNALLKMLEEPPEHVVFVLATTEKHKVLPTIISRCQGFDFRRPGVEILSRKLAEIAEAEGIEVESEALTVIAREGRGSFRDAEGLLDQLSSFAEGKVTAAMVRELLGGVGPEELLETSAALHERRAADSLRIVDRLSNEGRDLGQFVSELISHLRNLVLLPHAPEVALAEVGAEERGPLEEQAYNIPTNEVVRLIEALGDTSGRIKRGGDPKLELELSFLKLTRDYTEPSIENLLRRLEALEKRVANGTVPAPTRQPEDASPERAAFEPSDAPLEHEANEDSEDVRAAEGGRGGPESDEGGEREGAALEWRAVLHHLLERKQKASETIFREATVSAFDGESLELIFPREQEHLLSLAKDSRYSEPLQRVLQEHLGVKPRLQMGVSDEAATVSVPPPSEQPPPTAPEPHREIVHELEIPEPPSGVADADDPTAAEVQGRASGGSGGDDIIRDQHEVFEMARERFGSRDPNGGS
jgi:DNA polymerase-3 subunit gamma/tau